MNVFRAPLSGTDFGATIDMCGAYAPARGTTVTTDRFIVAGVDCDDYRTARDLAQQYADRSKRTIPVYRKRGQESTLVSEAYPRENPLSFALDPL